MVNYWDTYIEMHGQQNIKISGLTRNSCTKHRNLFVGEIWAGRHRRRCVHFAENEINEHRGQSGKSISNKPNFCTSHYIQRSISASVTSVYCWSGDEPIPDAINSPEEWRPHVFLSHYLRNIAGHRSVHSVHTKTPQQHQLLEVFCLLRVSTGEIRSLRLVQIKPLLGIYTKICYQTQNSDILS